MQKTRKQIHLTRIRFPEIQLKTRDAHKLRGYLGNLFKEHSPLLHNHWEDGSFRYRYPKIQYKVINRIPVLVGIEEGAELLPQLFLKIKEIDIDGMKYPVNSKNIEMDQEEVGFSENLEEYEFQTLWMALNQRNYDKYHRLKDQSEKQDMLNSIVVGHILSFFRNMKIELKDTERLMAKAVVRERATNFKGNRMSAFSGSFIVNTRLPNDIGLGKSVSRGFGAIIKR